MSLADHSVFFLSTTSLVQLIGYSLYSTSIRLVVTSASQVSTGHSAVILYSADIFNLP